MNGAIGRLAIALSLVEEALAQKVGPKYSTMRALVGSVLVKAKHGSLVTLKVVPVNYLIGIILINL